MLCVVLALCVYTFDLACCPNVLSHAYQHTQVVKECMDDLARKHPSVKQGRVVGLFGVIDLQKNTRGDFLGAVTDAPPALAAFKYVSSRSCAFGWVAVVGCAVVVWF